jgi:hypothetical protein
MSIVVGVKFLGLLMRDWGRCGKFYEKSIDDKWVMLALFTPKQALAHGYKKALFPVAAAEKFIG